MTRYDSSCTTAFTSISLMTFSNTFFFYNIYKKYNIFLRDVCRRFVCDELERQSGTDCVENLVWINVSSL
jgi:hypothetical protein